MKSYRYSAPLELSNLARARAKFYSLLSTFYIRSPDRDFLMSLRNALPSLDIPKLYETLPEGMVHALRTMDGLLRSSEAESLEALSAKMSIEFTRLFRGVKRHESPPPPYESVYREGLTFGEASVSVLEEYEKFGLDLSDRFKGEPPDHVSFELDFMRFLCDKEAEAWERRDQDDVPNLLKAEKRFLSEHLVVWVPALCKNIRKYDKLGFYQGVADITEGWVNFDLQLIDDLVDAYVGVMR